MRITSLHNCLPGTAVAGVCHAPHCAAAGSWAASLREVSGHLVPFPALLGTAPESEDTRGCAKAVGIVVLCGCICSPGRGVSRANDAPHWSGGSVAKGRC